MTIPAKATSCKHCKRDQRRFVSHSPAISLISSVLILLLSFLQFESSAARQDMLARHLSQRRFGEIKTAVIWQKGNVQLLSEIFGATDDRWHAAEVTKTDVINAAVNLARAISEWKQLVVESKNVARTLNIEPPASTLEDIDHLKDNIASIDKYLIDLKTHTAKDE